MFNIELNINDFFCYARISFLYSITLMIYILCILFLYLYFYIE